jgi:hypothetical protein
VQRRIDPDWDALGREGFEIASTAPDIYRNRVEVELITRRTDHAAIFRERYGPRTHDRPGDRERAALRAQVQHDRQPVDPDPEARKQCRCD